MKTTFLTIIFIVPVLLFAQVKHTPKKILVVVSSYGKEEGNLRPGYEFDEFSQAYLIFKNNGLSIDVASPRGGKVDADKFNLEKAYNKALSEDKAAMQLLENTKTTSSIKPEEYDAIYIVGGKGAMFDLPVDPALQDIVLDLYKREGTIISSVCHGPAALVNVKDGEEFIIKDVEITSFCNEEEELFGKKWVKEFPFMLEDKLKSRGAKFQEADFMLSKVSVSGKFITGQNPFSTTLMAEEVVKALGITPAKRELYSDERSIYLIQDVLNKKLTLEAAAAKLKKETKAFDIPLIAVYGYYRILAAKENKEELRKGVDISELTAPYFFNENLQFIIAKTYITLEEKEKAKKILNELISKNLIKEQAEKLLSEIQ